MANYKSFDINEATTPAPWGTREEAMVRDLIDTTVVGTVAGAKSTAGHKHYLIHNTLSEVVITADENATVKIGNAATLESSLGLYTSTTLGLSLTVNSSSDSTIDAHSNTIYVDAEDIYLEATGLIDLSVGASESITLTGGRGETIVLSGGTFDNITITSDYNRMIGVVNNVISSVNNVISSSGVSIGTSAGLISLVTATTGAINIGAGTTTISSANIILSELPTSSSGLTSGMLWSNSGVVTIV